MLFSIEEVLYEDNTFVFCKTFNTQSMKRIEENFIDIKKTDVLLFFYMIIRITSPTSYDTR